jgi:hypothetical protein
VITNDWNTGVPKTRGYLTNKDYEFKPDTRRADEKARTAKMAAMTAMDIKLKAMK